MNARIDHCVDVRDTRPAWGITYRRYSDTSSSHVRIQADSLDHAMQALTEYIGNTQYAVISVRQEVPQVPAVLLSDDTRLLLGQLADTLEARRPRAEMREPIRLARALVLAEQLHGPTEAAFAAEQDLLAAAPPVRPGQTRGDYAKALRSILLLGAGL